MAVHTASVTFKPTSVTDLILTANAVFDAVEAVGLQRITNSEFQGQCGRLTSEEPVGDQTKVVSLGTSAWKGEPYYNLYFHAGMNVYIKINIYDSGFATSANRAILVDYDIFRTISGATPHAPIKIDPFGPNPAYASNCLNGLQSGETTLRASSGPDYFWIASQPNIRSTTNSTSVGNKHTPTGKSLCAIALFRNETGITIVAPLVHICSYGGLLAGTNGNGNTGVVSNDTKYQFSAARYWFSDNQGSAFVFLGGSAAGYLPASHIPTTTHGLRIHKASIPTNLGNIVLDMGMISFASAIDGMILDIDMSGSGPSKYIVCVGFGNQNPAPAIIRNNDISGWTHGDFTVSLMPWRE